MYSKEKLIDRRKPSSYETYRPLKYQEMVNYKNKYDNRLYLSLKEKRYNEGCVTNEIFEQKRNHLTFLFFDRV